MKSICSLNKLVSPSLYKESVKHTRFNFNSLYHPQQNALSVMRYYSGNSEKDRTNQKSEEINNRGPRYWFLLLPIITFGLGTWQVYRLQWKKNLIEQIKQRSEEGSIDLPEKISDSDNDITSELSFRPINCEGKFIKEKVMFVGPRSYKGVNGYYVIVPFELVDKRTILVNCGWIAKQQKSEVEIPVGKLKVKGVIRPTQTPGKFTPINNADKGEWYWLDINSMANYCNTLPILIDLSTSIFNHNSNELKNLQHTSKPIAVGSQLNELPNNHMQYVLTWYTLSVALSIMSYLYIKRKI